MRDRLADFEPSAEVALVTFTSPVELRRYRDRHAFPFPVLADPDRAIYQAYGLGRGSTGRVWGLRAALGYLAVFRRRGWGSLTELRRPVEDPRQLGGDFVIDPDGNLAWGFWGDGPDDRPPVDRLVAEVAAAGHRRAGTEQREADG